MADQQPCLAREQGFFLWDLNLVAQLVGNAARVLIKADAKATGLLCSRHKTTAERRFIKIYGASSYRKKAMVEKETHNQHHSELSRLVSGFYLLE